MRFESGSGEIEFIRGAVSGNFAYLVLIERAQVRFAGHAEPQRWELRVTEVIHYTDGVWR